MKIALERHAYAPELNKALILNRGRVVAVLPAPHCGSIKDARRHLFRPVTPGHFARLQFFRGGESVGFYAGRIESPMHFLPFIRDMSARHKGGVLLDGSTLPDATYCATLALVG